ncbi:MAG: sodium pump decarboxylase subunit gamma, partial [Blautia sp.]|nr:sodium pump decarboxylase subunit gamma [Blautia sp.]
MKHIFKKVSSVCTALFCAATIIFAGVAAVWADEIDASTKATLISTSEGLTETIVGLSDEDIA